MRGFAAHYVLEFNPGNIGGGLAMWFDAADAATFTFGTGTAVAQWNDKSGNGRHVSQGTAGSRPSRSGSVNGLPTVVFDGGDILTLSGTTGIDVTAVTAFVVVSESSEAVNAGFFSLHNGSGNDFDSANAIALESGAPSAIFAVNRALSAGNGVATVAATGVTPLGVYAGRFSSNGVVKAWAGGGFGPVSTRSTTFGVASGGATIGGRYIAGVAGATFLTGQVCEVLVYASSLSDADLNTVGAYLANKWALSWATAS